jgi:FK506-binding protein 2
MRPLTTMPLCALIAPLLLPVGVSASLLTAIPGINSFAIRAPADELQIETTKSVPCNRKTRNGDTISVHYKGTLESDGSEFDSSYPRGRPFSFKIGKGNVIQGWDEGLLDMCPGEARRLTIPPDMGYGAGGSGPIPGGATLSEYTLLRKSNKEDVGNNEFWLTWT